MSFDLLLTDEAVCLDKAPGEPGAKAVPCTSDKAAFQLVGKGAPISAFDATRFGVKTTKADATNYTLRLDSHTIARTPEEKAYAATQPQPFLVAAQAEQLRASAALAVESLQKADQQKLADAQEESDKADADADKKLKADLAKPAKTTKADKKAAKAAKPKAERKPRKSKKAETKTEADKPASG